MACLTVLHRDGALLEETARLKDYLKQELNAKAIDYSTDEQCYIHLYARPNSPVLGKRLGKQFKTFKQKIEALDGETIEALQESGKLVLDGEQFGVDDILVYHEARKGTNAVSDRYIAIDMDCTLNDELIREGQARKVVNRVQKSHKESGFAVSDRISLNVQASAKLAEAIRAHEDYIRSETLTTELVFSENELDLSFDIDDEPLSLSLKVV